MLFCNWLVEVILWLRIEGKANEGPFAKTLHEELDGEGCQRHDWFLVVTAVHLNFGVIHARNFSYTFRGSGDV